MFLQVYVLPSVCFCNSWFCHVLLHLFVIKFILVSFFFYTMVVVVVKEVKSIVAMDDLDFGIRNVVFEAKVFYRYGNFDQIAIIKCAYGTI